MPKSVFEDESARLRASKILSAMANEKRFEVLWILRSAEMSVGDLAEKVNLSQSALSQHLTKLRVAGIVETRRDGQNIHYSCKSPIVHSVLALMEKSETKFAHAPKAA